MDVADQLAEVRLLLSDDGLESTLEEVSDALVAGVEGGSVPAKEAVHGPGEGDAAGAQQEVHVIGQQGPGINGQLTRRGQTRQAKEEVRPVAVVAKDGATFDTPCHDVVEGVGSIEPWAARHGRRPQEHGTLYHIKCHTSSMTKLRQYRWVESANSAPRPPNPIPLGYTRLIVASRSGPPRVGV